MEGNNVRIEQEDFRTARVFIDGNEVKDVKRVNYSIGVDDIPMIKLEFMPETLNFGVKDVVETTVLGDKYRSFIKTDKRTK